MKAAQRFTEALELPELTTPQHSGGGSEFACTLPAVASGERWGKGGSSNMLPTGYIASHVPGRIRIRIPATKDDPGLYVRIFELAKSLPGVKSVESNPLTGSLLILYAKDGFEDFGDRFAAAGDSVFELQSGQQNERSSRAAEPPAAISTTAAALTAAFRDLDRSIKEATGNAVDLKLLLPLAALTAGLFSIRKALATPLWVTLMIFAFSAFVVLNPTAEPERSRDLAPA